MENVKYKMVVELHVIEKIYLNVIKMDLHILYQQHVRCSVTQASVATP